MEKIKINDSKTLVKSMRRVKDSDEKVVATKKILKALLKGKVEDSNAVTLDKEDNWGNGTRVYMLFEDENGPRRDYGIIKGYSANGGLANVKFDDGYMMYDVDWSSIYLADEK